MALTYSCDTCETRYDATINGNTIVYMHGNIRTVVKSEDAPCYSCQAEIDTKIEEAKQKIKERKQNGNIH